jgi:hypothetical protein
LRLGRRHGLRAHRFAVGLTGWSYVGRNVRVRVGDRRFAIASILAGLLVVASAEKPKAARQNSNEHTCRNQQGFCRYFFYFVWMIYGSAFFLA